MRPRQLYRFEVVARPHEPETDKAGREKRWRATMLVAGNTQSCVDAINSCLAEKSMEATLHAGFEFLRKAKSREGPGVVEVLDEHWVWVEPRR